MDRTLLIGYLVLAVARISAIRNYLRLPTFKGSQYWFDVKVPDGFYQNQGKALQTSFQRALLSLAMIVEATCLADLLIFGKPNHVILVQLPVTIIGAIVRVAILRGFARRADEFESTEDRPDLPMLLS